jgi:acetylornithine aminotransferase
MMRFRYSLLCDSWQCGLSRTGKLWAHHHFHPSLAADILTMAKPLANGFPMGATMVSTAIADEIKVGDHGIPHHID